MAGGSLVVVGVGGSVCVVVVVGEGTVVCVVVALLIIEGAARWPNHRPPGGETERLRLPV